MIDRRLTARLADWLRYPGEYAWRSTLLVGISTALIVWVITGDAIKIVGGFIGVTLGMRFTNIAGTTRRRPQPGDRENLFDGEPARDDGAEAVDIRVGARDAELNAGSSPRLRRAGGRRLLVALCLLLACAALPLALLGIITSVNAAIAAVVWICLAIHFARG